MPVTINSGSTMYKASLVKFDDPKCIILEVHYDERTVATEIVQLNAITRKLTKYWSLHEKGPIEGRKFVLGEIVAVNLGKLWRPAMIVNFKYVKGLHHYELLVLDTGHLIEVHRMSFREVDEEIQLTSRYKLFELMNLFPAGTEARAHASWSVDACNDLRLLLHMASSITVDVMATEKSGNVERLFGNIYVHIATHVIDVKERMLKHCAALEDAEAFKRVYHFTEQDMDNQHHEEVVTCFEQEPGVSENVKVEEITDENLDEHLYECWRPGGSDPLSQVERESIRRKLRGEARITFTRHQHAKAMGTVLDNHVKESLITGNSDFPEFEIENERSERKLHVAFDVCDAQEEKLSVGRVKKTVNKMDYKINEETTLGSCSNGPRRLGVSDSAGVASQNTRLRREQMICFKRSNSEEEELNMIGGHKQAQEMYEFHKDGSEDKSLRKSREMDIDLSKVKLGISELSLECDELESHSSNVLRNSVTEDCDQRDTEEEPNQQNVFGKRVLPRKEHQIEVLSGEDERKLLALFK